MKKVYVTFKDEAKTEIGMALYGEQSTDVWPDLIAIDAEDPRHVKFLESMSPSKNEVVQAEIDRLISLASVRIYPLQDLVDLDLSTPESDEDLKKWKQYRVAVNEVTKQPTYPDYVEWPLQPE